MSNLIQWHCEWGVSVFVWNVYRSWSDSVGSLRNTSQLNSFFNALHHLIHSLVSDVLLCHTHVTHTRHTHTRHTHTHTHTHTSHTHTHTHMLVLYGLRGLSIGVMVFILYKLYVLLPYTYPIPKLSPHRRRCISTFPPKNSLCMIYKHFKLWGHWKCPHKSPSPCNTYVIPMLLYKFVSS